LVIVHSKVQGVSARALGQFAARAQRAAGVRGEVDVLVTSNAELRRLNRRFRGKNAATDVLSFPSADGNAGDITQIDLPGGARRSGLLEAIDILKNTEGVVFTYFDETDVVRHLLVQRIIRAYDEFKTRENQTPLVLQNGYARINGKKDVPKTEAKGDAAAGED